MKIKDWFRRRASLEELRVESGPRRVTAIATKELLSNTRTAEHYHQGALDAMGKVIILGNPMTYLDYYGEPVWYAYRWNAEVGKWLPVGVSDTEDGAWQLALASKG